MKLDKLDTLQQFHFSQGLLDEDKPLYFPKGSFLDGVLKYSPVKDHRLLYSMIQKHDSFITYTGLTMNDVKKLVLLRIIVENELAFFEGL